MRSGLAVIRSIVLLGLLGGCAGAAVSKPEVATPAAEPSAKHLDAWLQGDDALSRRMRILAEGLLQAGLRVGPIHERGSFAGGGRRISRLVLPARACVTVVAVASGGVRDIDATLYDPDGTVLAEDSEPDTHPTVQICTGDRPRHVYHALQAYRGSGAYLLGTFLGDRRSLGAARAVLGGRPGVAREPGTTSARDAGMASFGDGVRKRGFALAHEPLRVPVPFGERVRVGFPVRGARCYTVAVFADTPAHNLDLRVLDDEGSLVAHDASQRSDAAVQFCAKRRANMSAEIQGQGAAGVAVLSLYQADVTTVGGDNGLWLGVRSDSMLSPVALGRARAPRVAAAREAGYRPLREPFRGRLLAGEAVSHWLRLPAERCVRLAATGGKGIGRLALFAVAAGGAQFGAARPRGASAVLHVCSEHAQRIQVQLVARAGYGSYALDVWGRTDPPWLPESLGPNARARLLDAGARAAESGYAPRRGSGEPLSSLHLDASRRVHRRAFALDEGRCFRAHAVAEGGAEVSLRVTWKDRTVSTERGFAPHVRLCAPRQQALDSLTLEATLVDTPQGKLHLLSFEK